MVKLPRVTYLARSLDIGGAEVQLAELATGAHGSAIDASVVTFYPGGALESRLVKAGVPLFSANKRGRWDSAGFASRLLKHLRRLRPQILHSYLETPNLAAAAVRRFLPDAKLVWGLRSSDMDLRFYDWSRLVVSKTQTLLSRAPDAVVANSHSGRNFVLANGFRNEVEVISNGIDVERFQPRESKLRQDLLNGAAGPLIGLVARFDPMKDHRTFLSAARLFADLHPSCKFVCVGGGPEGYVSEIRESAAKLSMDENIAWLDWRDDMVDVTNAFDIATLSSAFGEGFPNTVGEAMACGVPCVVTDVGDAALIVGDAGIVVPRRAPDALARGWAELWSMSEFNRSKLGTQARDRIACEYSLRAMITRTASLYQDLLS